MQKAGAGRTGNISAEVHRLFWSVVLSHLGSANNLWVDILIFSIEYQKYQHVTHISVSD